MDPAIDTSAKEADARDVGREGAAGHAWLALAVLAVVAGIAARIAAARGQLWLDEIWSWALARMGGSVGGVFALAHDNNHPLNTLWLLVVGETDAWIVYRIPALIAGAAALVLVAWIPLARRNGDGTSRSSAELPREPAARSWRGTAPIESAFAALLFASSFLLATVQSEARGYSLAILAALVGYASLARHLERPGVRSALLFGASAIVGLLSHLTWLHAYAGLAAWSLVHALTSSGPIALRAKRLLALHAIPLAAIGIVWATFGRWIVVGGGPARPLVEVLGSALDLGLGAPDVQAFALVLAVFVLVLLVVDSVALARRGSAEWIMAPVCVVMAPALWLAALRTDFVAPRYFLVALAALLIVVARRSADLVARGGAARIAGCVIVLAITAGNLARLGPFVRHGRGHYLEALQEIQRSASTSPATLGSGGNYDLSLMLDFYGHFLADGPDIDYVRAGDGTRTPEWLVVQSDEVDPQPAREVRQLGARYRLVDVYRYYGQSGCHWILYRRDT